MIVRAHALFFSVMRKSSTSKKLFFSEFTLIALFCILEVEIDLDANVSVLSVVALREEALEVSFFEVKNNFCLRDEIDVHSTLSLLFDCVLFTE